MEVEAPGGAPPPPAPEPAPQPPARENLVQRWSLTLFLLVALWALGYLLICGVPVFAQIYEQSRVQMPAMMQLLVSMSNLVSACTPVSALIAAAIAFFVGSRFRGTRHRWAEGLIVGAVLLALMLVAAAILAPLCVLRP